jgi:hypothetical protein
MEMSTCGSRPMGTLARMVSPRYTDGGFVEGSTSITYGGQLYKVAGYSNNGWPPHWNAIVKGDE